MPSVSVFNTGSYDDSEMEKAVRAHFDNLRLEKAISREMKIVVKPNLIARRDPEDAATTHPKFVKAIILHLQSLGCQNITIAESGGGPYNEALLKSLYEGCGMAAVAKETGVKLNLGTEVARIERPGLATSYFTVIRPVAEADLIVSVCKLKTHSMTFMSGAVKNLFGCVPGLMKPELHMRYPDGEDFARMLLDLSLTVPKTISFVDAVDAMEGDGPTGGIKKHVGLTLCSWDIYALDLVNSAIIGARPADIPTVRQAIERGLCPDSLDKITFAGGCPSLTKAGPFIKPRAKQLDFSSSVPAPFAGIVKKAAAHMQPRPKINLKLCVGCGKCAESCPAHTIRILNGKAAIDNSKCIRCFCCQEMCPKKAVDIRRFSIFNL